MFFFCQHSFIGGKNAPLDIIFKNWSGSLERRGNVFYSCAVPPVLTLNQEGQSPPLLSFPSCFSPLCGSCSTSQMLPFPFQSGPNERDICLGGCGCLQGKGKLTEVDRKGWKIEGTLLVSFERGIPLSAKSSYSQTRWCWGGAPNEPAVSWPDNYTHTGGLWGWDHLTVKV